MSRRARQRQDARPWRSPAPTEPAIDWQALAADRQRREQAQHQQQHQQKGTP